MSLSVFNTMTKKKELFEPISPPKVGMYVCGITAYDRCHLGHARGAVAFDVIYRYLKYSGYDVTFVRNYTDVDDKIIKRANEQGVDCSVITKKYIAEYERNMKDLGNLPPDVAPRATEHIPEMIATIQSLIDAGLAYVVGGDVFYSVRAFRGYGKLSGKNIEDLESGARVDVNETKNDPLDFALWKNAKPNEPKWPSPWGEGRPGWHIECSAMSSKYLGKSFDIHGGGRDLIFPHHENELAQSEGACKCQFVKYWLHNGFVNVDSEKMSKSLGNIMAIDEILSNNDAEAVRFFIISSHYRSPIDYTENAIPDAKASLDRFYETAERLSKIHPGKSTSDEPDGGEEGAKLKKYFESFDAELRAAMNDDFNTARAIALVFEGVRFVNRYLDAVSDKPTAFAGWVVLQFTNLQHICGDVLGVFGSCADSYRERTQSRVSASAGISASEIESLLAERRDARKNKNFKRGDEIRDELTSRGVEIKDKPDGTTEWKFK